MSKFVVGEVALAVGQSRGTRECEIVRLTKARRWGNQQCYIIHVPSLRSRSKDGNWSIPEDGLKKKKPPKEELGSWEQVSKITKGWNPAKEKANA